MGAVGRFFVTPHAVHRYQQRVRRWQLRGGLAALIEAGEAAHKVRDLGDGVELWRAHRRHGGIRLRVARMGEGLPQVMTVLPACSSPAWLRRNGAC